MSPAVPPTDGWGQLVRRWMRDPDRARDDDDVLIARFARWVAKSPAHVTVEDLQQFAFDRVRDRRVSVVVREIRALRAALHLP